MFPAYKKNLRHYLVPLVSKNTPIYLYLTPCPASHDYSIPQPFHPECLPSHRANLEALVILT
ncbi:hypothetical protein E2C01_062564 [Portunus trituberculatus]|uniref:Uncharacterized protein n=1 Tax=Portunus trituberculatus TaxID=210409 RepID=A0A5B7HID7_PORTR|nr:hypothetical protein [Portunus trituberculatus]